MRNTHWDDHSHPTHELLWNERGASTATIGSRTWTVTPSVGLWIPAGVLHSGWMPAGTWYRAAQFSVVSVPSISADAVAVEISPLLRQLLERLAGELEPDARSRTEAVVLDVLTPASRSLLLRMPRSELLAPIARALRDDPGDTTPLSEWATRLGVSTRTITRDFRAETGLGFGQWVATVRAHHAITELAQGVPIDEVAAMVGYTSASAFGTAFRRITGESPGRFRAS
ncbi:AraC family transcriptional regulator [Agromyces atrinae]|nr:AraC family transcriptional regulator [Agromyces atrinae]